MVGHLQLPWINNPTPGSASVTSAKQELEICNNEPDRTSGGKSLSNYQNTSASYLTLTKTNTNLRKENEILKKLSARLHEETKLLNKTSAKLKSVNVALTSERSKLLAQIVNLTSVNLQLKLKHERYTSEQEAKKLNMSQTVKHLVSSNALREEEKRRLSETSSLLSVQLLQLKEKNQELVEIRDKFEGEVESLRERMMELQEQNKNLSRALVKEREGKVEQERSSKDKMEQMVADMQSVNEAYHSLDLYCPMVDHETKERFCRKCDDSWRLFKTKCYYFSSRTLTWSSSRAWCQTQGGDLLVINSEQEQVEGKQGRPPDVQQARIILLTFSEVYF